MPVYEYKCDECHKITEQIYSMLEHRPEVIKCIHCGCEKSKRQYGGIAFRCDAATGGTSFKSSVGD